MSVGVCRVQRMSPDAVEPEFLTIREVAALMRYSPDQIGRLCRAGKIAGARRFGSSWRIHRRTFLESIDCTDDPHEALGRTKS